MTPMYLSANIGFQTLVRLTYYMGPILSSVLCSLLEDLKTDFRYGTFNLER